MIRKENITEQAKALRKRAEAILTKNQGEAADPDASADLLQLLHELEVYHVELEMQAQELWIAQAKEKSARERLSSLYEHSSTGLFDLQSDGRIIGVNPAGARLLGMDQSQLQQRHFWNLVSVDSRQVFDEFFGKLMEQPGQNSCQISLINHEGALIYVEAEGILSLDRELAHLALRDITRQKKMEEALHHKVKEVEHLTALVHKKDQQIKELQKNG